MKTFKWYDITCALTHDIETCEHCRKCGDDGAKIRVEMVEYVKTLDKALDIACSYNVCFLEECDRLPTHRTCKDCRKDFVLSKANWEIEREKQ